MSDSIEDIRARHKAVHELIEYDLPSQMHDDREMLLAEVDRLTRENDAQRAEVDRLRLSDNMTRAALGSWVFVPPDGGAEPTHERVGAVVAEVETLRTENARLRARVEEYFREPDTHPVEGA